MGGSATNAPLFGMNRLAVVSVVVVWAVVCALVPGIFFFDYGADNWSKRSTDRVGCEACSCFSDGKGCWDGRFKGSFPTGGLKSVWFNMDLGTAFILLDVMVYATLAVETSKHVLGLLWADAAQMWGNAAISLV